MASKTRYLNKKGLLKAVPHFLDTGVQYEVIMGSYAYGVSSETSDMDIYGFAIPPRDQVFPHLNGYIHGLDELPEVFEQFQQHHILDTDAEGGKGRTYDLTVYSIVKYFRLLTNCNPNIIDSLFAPRHCVVYTTAIGERIRECRQMFLNKGCWPTFKGYAYSQMHKIKSKVPEGKRRALVDAFGFDVKFAYHVVRLLSEVEEILVEHTLTLNRNSEQLKAIRRGEWSLERLQQYINDKENNLENLYAQSRLPVKSDQASIKQLLLECLEEHYGSLQGCWVDTGHAEKALTEIQQILNRYR